MLSGLCLFLCVSPFASASPRTLPFHRPLRASRHLLEQARSTAADRPLLVAARGNSGVGDRTHGGEVGGRVETSEVRLAENGGGASGEDENKDERGIALVVERTLKGMIPAMSAQPHPPVDLASVSPASSRAAAHPSPAPISAKALPSPAKRSAECGKGGRGVTAMVARADNLAAQVLLPLCCRLEYEGVCPVVQGASPRGGQDRARVYIEQARVEVEVV